MIVINLNNSNLKSPGFRLYNEYTSVTEKLERKRNNENISEFTDDYFKVELPNKIKTGDVNRSGSRQIFEDKSEQISSRTISKLKAYKHNLKAVLDMIRRNGLQTERSNKAINYILQCSK